MLEEEIEILELEGVGLVELEERVDEVKREGIEDES